MSRAPVAVLLLGLKVALCGCAGGQSRGIATSDDVSVDTLSLFTSPTVINFDSRPGADGLSAQVYAFHRALAKAIRLTSGTLDVLLFEGIVYELGGGATPRWSWSYDAGELLKLEGRTLLGASYGLTVRWDGDEPNDDRVTLFVRYRPENGAPVVSKPVSLPLRLR